jgi:hypothetical protein
MKSLANLVFIAIRRVGLLLLQAQDQQKPHLASLAPGRSPARRGGYQRLNRFGAP